MKISKQYIADEQTYVVSISKPHTNTIQNDYIRQYRNNIVPILACLLGSNIKPTAEYNLINEKPVVAPNNYFLLHIKISSLHANLDELKELLLAIKIVPALIFICETRIRNNPLFNVNIDGYSFMHKPSPTQAEGIRIYVRNDIRVKRNDYFDLNLEGCEDLWIDVELNCSKNQYLFGSNLQAPE